MIARREIETLGRDGRRCAGSSGDEQGPALAPRAVRRWATTEREIQESTVNRKPIEQQVMVVMGAASGIGRETALQLASQGASLVVADFDGDGLTSLMTKVVPSGGRVVPMVADVASFEQMAAVAERAVVEFGGLDTWVHVAATSIYAPFTDTTPDEFQRVVNVDLMGQVYGAQAASIAAAGLAAGAVLAQRTGEGRKIEEVVRKNVEGVLNR
jgi:enoyl-[acyl-carrier-protein] reductase (NADH)